MLAVALAAMGVLAGAGLFLTDAPPAIASMLAVAAAAWAGALAWREWRRRPEALVLRSDGAVQVGPVAVDGFRVDWQGPLTKLEWRQAGRRVRRVAWPDVVDAAARRELRLWTLGRAVRASTAAVAP